MSENSQKKGGWHGEKNCVKERLSHRIYVDIQLPILTIIMFLEKHGKESTIIANHNLRDRNVWQTPMAEIYEPATGKALKNIIKPLAYPMSYASMDLLLLLVSPRGWVQNINLSVYQVHTVY